MSRNRNTAPAGSMQAVVGSLMSVVFMVFWTGTAVSAGAPFIFPVFGAFGLYVTMTGLIKNVRAYRQKKQQEDFYNGDLYTGHPADPWEKDYTDRDSRNCYSGSTSDVYQYTDAEGNIYCPYCGVKVAHDFEYCPKCGRNLPFENNQSN